MEAVKGDHSVDIDRAESIVDAIPHGQSVNGLLKVSDFICDGSENLEQFSRVNVNVQFHCVSFLLMDVRVQRTKLVRMCLTSFGMTFPIAG